LKSTAKKKKGQMQNRSTWTVMVL